MYQWKCMNQSDFISHSSQDLLWHWPYFIPYLSVWPLASHTLQTTVMTSLCMQSVMPQAMRDSGVCLSISLSHCLQPCVMKLAVQQYLGPLQPLKLGRFYLK